MTLQNLLETFDNARTVSGSRSKDPAELAEIEQIKSAAFEQGYASGWEDATKSDKEAKSRVDAEFERNIQNLAFTYNEAVDRVRGELKGFVATLIQGFFPEIVPDLLREHVRTELIRIADGIVEAPIEIVVSPDSLGFLEEMLEKDFSLDIKLIEDVNLASRQVFIRIAEREIEVNLAPLLSALQAQFSAVSNSQKDEAINV